MGGSYFISDWKASTIPVMEGNFIRPNKLQTESKEPLRYYYRSFKNKVEKTSLRGTSDVDYRHQQNKIKNSEAKQL